MPDTDGALQGLLLVAILGGGDAVSTFSVNDTFSRTKTYMTFILAFVAITSIIVSPSSAVIPQQNLIVPCSALRAQLCTSQPGFSPDEQSLSHFDILPFLYIYSPMFPLSPYAPHGTIYGRCILLTRNCSYTRHSAPYIPLGPMIPSATSYLKTNSPRAAKRLHPNK